MGAINQSCCNIDFCMLIEICDVYALSPLSSSNRIEEKKSVLVLAHENGIKPLLGEECYDAICEALKDAEALSNLSDDWKKVTENLQFKLACARWIYYYWLLEYGDGETAEVGMVDFNKQNEDGTKSFDRFKFNQKVKSALTLAEQASLNYKPFAEKLPCNKKDDCNKCDIKIEPLINNLNYEKV